MKLEDAQKLAARLLHPEYYVDACDEAADAIVKMAKTIKRLKSDINFLRDEETSRGIERDLNT